MPSHQNRFRQQAPPAPLYVPSSTDNEVSSEDAYVQAHRYSTLPEEDYISPTKNRAGRYTYGQPASRHASQVAHTGRRTAGVEDTPERAERATTVGGRFRVCLHHTEGVLEEMERRHLMAPSLYMALHTAEERGHSRTVHRSYNPVFTDMFDFQSSRPDKDALVCTLVALPVTPQGKERKVAECVVSLKNLMWGVEREVWVPMVRHAGTKYAYEQGEVKLSVFSDDFGVEALPTEEEETAFSIEAQRILRKYAPHELHRLDWIVGEHLMDGDQGLLDIRAEYGPGGTASTPRAGRHGHRGSVPTASLPRKPVEDRTVAELSRRSRSSAVNRMLMVPPAPTDKDAVHPFVKVRVTVQEVTDLTGLDGGPLTAKSCYVTFRTRGNELRTPLYRYSTGRALFGSEAYELSLDDPVADPIEVTVCAGGRCLGEAQMGLANVQAGSEKKVELVLVRAAETADACLSGRLCLTLCPVASDQDEGYTSPFLWSKSEERKVRERVQAYLWTYLRDDLHRLDAIVGTIDVPDAYMREWTRTIGPEPVPKHLSLLIRDGSDLFDDNASHTVFVRATCGPYSGHTRTRTVRGSETTAIQHAMELIVLNPDRDPLELMVVEAMPNGTEREVSRIVLGLKHVPRRDTFIRTAQLVAHACSRSAVQRGRLTLEMVAQDFGVSARHIMEAAEFDEACTSMSRRCAAEERHRVPYVVDTADPRDDVLALLGPRTVAVEETSSHVTPAASAPMTVRVIGFKNFAGLREGCYVEAVVKAGPTSAGDDGAAPMLRTREKKSVAQEVALDIGDDNEATTNFKYTPTSTVSLRVMRSRRFRKDQVLAQAEVALANMVCGETNTVWVPLAAAAGASGKENEKVPRGKSNTGTPAADAESDVYDEEDRESMLEDDRIRDNRLPKSLQRKAREVREANENAGFMPPPTSASQQVSVTSGAATGAASSGRLGLIGVELWSNAFPITSVVSAEVGESADGARLTPLQAVTRDVTSLVRRYKPEKEAQVQALIAQCTSLQEAHAEIRSEICPRDVEATVYLHIDSIQMDKQEGIRLESKGEVGVVATFGSEHQVTQKRLVEGKLVYAPMRLDLPGPEQQRVPSLQLTLVPLTGGAGAWAIAKTGGEGASRTEGTPYATGSGAYAQRAGERGATGPRRRHRRSTLGGRNNLMNYINTSNLPANDAEDQGGNYRNGASGGAQGNGSRREAAGAGAGARSADTDARAEPVKSPGAVVVTGGLGTVRLSLRALLSHPIHTLGDRIRVPIVSTQSPPGRRHSFEPEVVGQVEFHLSAPAFETFPEWTNLASRSVLSEVEPAYVHYYLRRIGAYLRQCAPADLVDFHYGFFERDVASGSWPVSLYDWMLALQKRFRTREAKDFGPEPKLRFNPEEREARRQMESYYARQSAFAEPQPRTQRTRKGTSAQAGRDDDNGSSLTPERHRHADPEAELEPRTEPPRRAAHKKQSSQSRQRQEPVYSF